jgi:hypothetical protein
MKDMACAVLYQQGYLTTVELLNFRESIRLIEYFN